MEVVAALLRKECTSHALQPACMTHMLDTRLVLQRIDVGAQLVLGSLSPCPRARAASTAGPSIED